MTSTMFDQTAEARDAAIAAVHAEIAQLRADLKAAMDCYRRAMAELPMPPINMTLSDVADAEWELYRLTTAPLLARLAKIRETGK